MLTEGEIVKTVVYVRNGFVWRRARVISVGAFTTQVKFLKTGRREWLTENYIQQLSPLEQLAAVAE